MIKDKKWGYLFLALCIGAIIISPTFLTEKSQVLDANTSYSDMFNFKNFFIPQTIDGDQGQHYFSLPNGVYAFYGFFHPA